MQGNRMSTRPALAILGAGGHARAVAECILLEQRWQVCAFIDNNEQVIGTTIMDVPVWGPDAPQSVAELAYVVGIGQNEKRLQLFLQLQQLARNLPAIVHPRAWVSPSAQLGAGTVVMAGAMVQTNAHIGQAVIINTAASVDHDNIIADGVHIAPGAHLGGQVSVGIGSHIGIGATVIEGVKIGAHCVIAAGAVVIRDVPDYARVAGVPAQLMKKK
jgi:sugar O-acyltransferase (sialic acid O-acetyltransferase NeuD family)